MREGRARGTASRERVMFVTRRFPPTVGGQELYAQLVDRALRRECEIELVALRRQSLRHLAWFLPWSALRVAWRTFTRDVDRVVFGDAFVYALGGACVFPPATADLLTLGLDVSYPNPWYRRALRHNLRRTSHVVALSDAGAARLEDLGMDVAAVSVVTPGIDPPEAPVDRRLARDRLLRRLSLDDEAFVVALVGRLIRRKGTTWFVDQVVPRLPPHVHCVIAGDGPERDGIEAAIAHRALDRRVTMLGRIDDRTRDDVYGGSDLIVMPNVAVDGDLEGFGLVAVEATFAGCPVVASDIEGLRDSVVDGETGYSCPEMDADAFTNRIVTAWRDQEQLRRDAKCFRANALERFSYERMAEDLVAALDITTR